jgi:PAS domain S-box-containing protein
MDPAQASGLHGLPSRAQLQAAPVRPFSIGLLGRIRMRSLRWRLLALFTAVLGAISLFIFLFFPAALERQALQGLRAKAEGLAAAAAYPLSPAVAFSDRSGMDEALAAVLADRDVLRAELRAPDGRILTARSDGEKAGGGARPLDPADLLVYTAPIVSSGVEIATLSIELSLGGLRAGVARARGLVALVSFAVFVLGLLAAMAIAAHVTAPLRQVAATAERIAAGDLASRASVDSRDEVGQLAATFNRMVDRLQDAHREVEAARHRLEEVLDHIPADVAMFDPSGRYVYLNPAVLDDPGERSRLIGRTPTDFAVRLGLGEEHGREAMETIAACVHDRRRILTEMSSTPADGEERHFVRSYSPIFDEAGDVGRVIAHGVDVTELRQAEAELRDTQERLLQSQKMESVGRLAGGVAHDFNNLLTTMAGNADLLLMEEGLAADDRELVEEILEASRRAADLTQQLLAFSRKQVTQPKVLDLNQTISGIEKMLRRLIGEDVELITTLEEPLASVRADPGQIEQVIVNLAVNARDAMPRGGMLTLSTSTVLLEEEYRGAFDHTMPAGRYVQVTVADAGTGMDRPTLERIFEPFFTNKEVGKGTGLGLATAYGIVHQAEGFIRVYSEPGLGTTFKIFFPALAADADPLEVRRSTSVLDGGTETILVAEDQDGVRTMTTKVLERCGYRVLSAEGPRQALGIAERYREPIDLLLTDVIMPGMSGPDLVAALASTRPDTAVVYMSGYTDDQLQHHGVLDEGVVLVQKPFTAAGLTSTIRALLDRRAARA